MNPFLLYLTKYENLKIFMQHSYVSAVPWDARKHLLYMGATKTQQVMDVNLPGIPGSFTGMISSR